MRRESVARYEERVEKLDDTSGFIDLSGASGPLHQRQRIRLPLA